MPKPKLGWRRRRAIREWLARRLDEGMARGEILEKASRRYGVTKPAVRWYLKRLEGGPAEVEGEASGGEGAFWRNGKVEAELAAATRRLLGKPGSFRRREKILNARCLEIERRLEKVRGELTELEAEKARLCRQIARLAGE